MSDETKRANCEYDEQAEGGCYVCMPRGGEGEWPRELTLSKGSRTIVAMVTFAHARIPG